MQVLFPVLREQELFLECGRLSLGCCNFSQESPLEYKVGQNFTLDPLQISKEQNPTCLENKV